MFLTGFCCSRFAPHLRFSFNGTHDNLPVVRKFRVERRYSGSSCTENYHRRRDFQLSERGNLGLLRRLGLELDVGVLPGFRPLASASLRRKCRWIRRCQRLPSVRVSPEEAFFGLGEQTGIGNLRGWRVPVWTREGGAGRGEEPITSVLNANPSVAGQYAGGSLLTTYTAVASLTSSLGRWIVLDGTSYALFNLASNATSPFKDTAQSFLAGDIIEGDHSNSSSTTVEIQYEGPSISGWLGRVTGGNALLEATGALTNVTGRQPTLPDWVNDGAILGIQGGQEFVETVIQDAQNASLPLVSVWLQDWSGTRLQAGTYGIDVHRLWWNWEPDTTLYPTWAEWVPYLREHYDVRTLSYVNTFLANLSTKSTGFNTNFYDIAKREGRYVTNTTAGDGSVWT